MMFKSHINFKNAIKKVFMLTAFGRFLGGLLKLVANILILSLNVSILDYLNELQSVFFENCLFDQDKVIYIAILISICFFFYFYGRLSQIFHLMKKSILWINVLVLMTSIYILYLHEKAFSPKIVIIPAIGLAIIKIKWTDEQLQTWFEEFQKGIAYIFTEDEKIELIKIALNPSDLKEKMIEKVLERLSEAPLSAGELLKNFLWFILSLTVGLGFSYIAVKYGNIEPEIISKYAIDPITKEYIVDRVEHYYGY